MFGENCFARRPWRPVVCGWFGNPTTRDCIFSLDTTRAAAQNPRNFFREFLVQDRNSFERAFTATPERFG
jgi:hypothetical protein